MAIELRVFERSQRNAIAVEGKVDSHTSTLVGALVSTLEILQWGHQMTNARRTRKRGFEPDVASSMELSDREGQGRKQPLIKSE